MQLLSGDARRAVFAPLDDGALRSEAVVRRVGSAIGLGLLADGEQLPTETDLATMLNVSTMTLREALSELRKLGLVQTRRGRGGGSFVCSRDDVLAELADARLAELGTTDLRELGDVHGAVAAAARPDSRHPAPPARRPPACATSSTGWHPPAPSPASAASTGRYYIELAACAQSVRLTMQEMDLHLELGQLPWPPAHSPGLLDVIVAGHRAVVDAIEDRDAARARALAEAHVETRTLWAIELRLQRLGGAAAAPRGEREVS